MDIKKRLIAGFLSEMHTGKRTANFQRILDNNPEEIIDDAFSEAIEKFDFEKILKGHSVREFINYDNKQQNFVLSSKPTDKQKQIFSLGNNEKFILFSELINLDAQQITFVRIEGNSMKDLNIEDGDIAVIRNTDTASSGAIIIAKINDNYYLKKYMIINNQLWLYSANIDFEPIMIPKNVDFSIFGIVCNVIKNISL